MKRYILLFDFGHGTRDYTKGKCSPDKTIYEGEWNREIGMKIVNELRMLGFDCRVIVSEDSDISLQERCNRANKIIKDNPTKQCLYISIHINAAGKGDKWYKASGWTVWVAKNADNESIRMAQDFYDIAEQMDLKGDRSVPTERCWRANYKVLTGTKCPSILTENMFMDNEEEVKWLVSDKGKDTIVSLHVMGICKYVGYPYGYCKG